MSTTRKVMRGEVYYIKSFPTVGHEQKSGRPAVIVSNNENNANSGTLEICYMTLQDKPKMPTHVYVDSGPCHNSTILCEQVTTISVDKLGDFMCLLPDDLMGKVNKAIVVSLGLSYPSNQVKCSTSLRGNEAYHATPVAVMNELKALKDENLLLKKELDRTHTAFDDLKTTKSRADMYERMYNDLLDRLVKRG